MLWPADRQDLCASRDRLRHWGTSVARDAAEFHQVRVELLDQADDALRHFGVFASPDAARAVSRQVAELAAVADGLAALFAQRVTLESAIEDAVAAAEDLDDAAILQQVQTWRAQWRADLARYGSHVR